MKLFKIMIISAFLFATEDKKSELENVQVLPFTTKSDVMKYMKKTIAAELGVKCNYCHNIKNYSSDENKHKIAAREMMRMVLSINKNTMKSLELRDISCWSCHRGKKRPDYK